MQIETACIFGIVVIRLDGHFIDEIELARNIEAFEKAEAPKVLINFENVEYINTNCFRSLAMMHQLLVTNGGDLRICSLKHMVRRLFGFANLDSGYHIYNSEDEGIISFYNNLPSVAAFPIEATYSS